MKDMIVVGITLIFLDIQICRFIIWCAYGSEVHRNPNDDIITSPDFSQDFCVQPSDGNSDDILNFNELFFSLANLKGISIILCPFLLACIIFILSNKLNENKILFITGFWNLNYLIFLFLFFDSNLKYHKISFIKIFDSFNIFDFNFFFDIVLDSVTFIMLFVVIFISYCVTVFSYWYMKKDPNFLKFLVFLNFFSFFMLILVASNNLILIFVGWEGIGIFSYLLINFWNGRLNSNRSALKAILLNKIGDIFFYFFMFMYFFMFDSLQIYEVKNLVNFYTYYDSVWTEFKIINVMIFCIIIAAMAKSAQIILHVWLPDAMEGPTPVSALLHAATMVTAGIYILIKFNWLIFYNESVYCFVILIGIFTNLMASLIAIFQYDIKKIVAYSTASQLGLIFIAYGTLKFNFALFHMFNHAFFKALLFILSGIIIHLLKNKQDLRSFFVFKSNITIIYVIFILSSLTLIGFPFLSAFYSKDFIINYSFINIIINKSAVVFFLKISIITTFIYTFKIVNFLFFNKQNITFVFKNIKSNDILSVFNYLYLILCILCIFSVFIGYIFSFYFQYDFLTFSANFMFNIYLENKNYFSFLEESFLIILFLFLFCLPLLLFRIYFIKEATFIFIFWKIFTYFNKKTLFDNFYFYLTKATLSIIHFKSIIIDKNIIEYLLIFLSKNLLVLINFIKNIYLNSKWYFFIFYIFSIFFNICILFFFKNYVFFSLICYLLVLTVLKVNNKLFK